MKLRPMKTDYELLKELARDAHRKMNICGGTILQHQLYLHIKASGKHQEVYEDYPVPILDECNNDRKTHKQDILIIDGDNVIGFNSKGASFNNTDSYSGQLKDAKDFKVSLQALFPDKKVTYGFLKEKYVRGNGKGKTSKYDKFQDDGFPVYNTEDYINEHYGDYDSVQRCREQQMVYGFKEVFKVDYDSLLQVLDPRRVPVNKPARSGRQGDMDAL